MEFPWALKYPDIHKICLVLQRTELLHPTRVHFTALPVYIQEGPQCGLVALAICRGDPCKENVDRLFEIAKDLDYTYNGEICSVRSMRHLCEVYLEESVQVGLYEGRLDTDDVKAFLLSGGMMLVPFDSDQANNPGCHNGHRAHWCVISGAIETDANFYVVARHGKARNVTIWTLKELADSNAQLNEFSPTRLQSELPYKLPDGGIGGPNGLKLKSVMLSKDAA